MKAPPPSRAAGFYDPRTYDWEIGSSLSRADRCRFYVAQTSHPGAHVLELGCGTGDIALAIAEHGAQVIGLDSSHEMIDTAVDKARRRGCTTTRWIQGHMESFVFHTRFTAVIIPYHAIFHVLSQTTLDELLARIHQHLEPGGVLLADIFTRPPGTPIHRRAFNSTPTPDGIYNVAEDEHFNPATGRLRTRFTYRLECPHSGQILDTWTRYLDYLVTEPDILTSRLRRAGFTAVTHFAAFDHRRSAAPGEDVALCGVRSPYS
jgi:ubiquinone/menaquinone biosynthesis C-methylase UbiE